MLSPLLFLSCAFPLDVDEIKRADTYDGFATRLVNAGGAGADKPKVLTATSSNHVLFS